MRLTEKYSEVEINQMKIDNPAYYNMLVYALDNACYVTDLPKGKSDAVTGTVSMDPNKAYTFAELGLEIKRENQYLKIEGTSKMLVVKSEWVLNNELSNKK